jgi:acetyl-CoA carboxylase carboxyl transferase subunit beta
VRQLFDAGSVEFVDVPIVDRDPLGFVDSVPYPQRIAAARKKTGLDEAALCVRGRIGGSLLVAAVMDFAFMGGSLGSAAGEVVTCAAELALGEGLPLLLVCASGGARMQEGALSLMQMAKTAAALRRLDEAGVLTVSLVTDPTYGGVAASFATLCDVVIAEPGARLGFAGPRVIEQILRQRLPAGFQSAERLLSRGLIDAIRPRFQLRGTIGHLLAAVRSGPVLPRQRRAGQGEHRRVGTAVITDPERLDVREPWAAVQAARDLQRPTTLDYIGLMLTDFEELRGDRVSGDCPAIVGGIGRLAGRAVVVVGHQKAHDFEGLAANGFGMPTPDGYRKAARLARLADKLGLPVVTFVDTPGAHAGVEAEDHGQAIAIAQSLALFSGLRVPVVAVILGEGGSGGAHALAVGNRVLMCENATYSVISPEGCASILWPGTAGAARAAQALRLDARSLLRLGIVDGVVREPAGGSGADYQAAAGVLSLAVSGAFEELKSLGEDELVAQRYARFRHFGSPLPALVAEVGENPVVVCEIPVVV